MGNKYSLTAKQKQVWYDSSLLYRDTFRREQKGNFAIRETECKHSFQILVTSLNSLIAKQTSKNGKNPTLSRPGLYI